MRLTLHALVALGALEAVGTLGSCPVSPPPGGPLPGLTSGQLADFQAGRAVFQQQFVPENGLGPLFNANACAECHEDPTPGGNGEEVETHATVERPGGDCDMLLAHGGPVFQSHATPALQQALGIDREPIPAEATVRATRTSPDLFGFGLLDAVPDLEILARADPEDADGDGISGRVNRFVDGRIGRFGRKAFLPSLDEFNAGAFVIEMGITSPDAPEEESIGGMPIPAGVDPAPDPELSAEAVGLTQAFVRFLAPPAPLPMTPLSSRGRVVFRDLGCTSCHTPALTTGRNRIAALDRRVVYAYTDLLLHDMGESRADICLGLATPSEFRTEPLMGLRFVTRFLHDGAASSIEEAIELHDGEAAASRDRFRRARARDREALLAFLRSL